MITVLGASGKTGKATAEILLKKGHKVRVLGRDKAKLQALADAGAEIRTGNVTDVAFLTDSLKGADAAYTLIPPNLASPNLRAEQDQTGEAITRAVKDSGIKHVVFLSSVGAEQPAGTGPIAGLHAQEQRFRTLSGVNVLLLRPGYFFENHFANLGMIKHQGINGGAIAPDLPFVQIASRDIAEVAAQALDKRDFAGVQVRELMGQRDLSMNEATRILGARIGKPDLQYIQFPYDAFAAALTQFGISSDVARLYAEMARAFNEGRVRPIEGRNPRNTTPTAFEAFVDVLAGAYKAL